MKTEENIKTVQKFYQLIEDNKYDEVLALCHPDFKFFSQVDTSLNREQFITQEKGNMDAFPGFTMRIHEAFAKEDKVACYLIFEGVTKKNFMVTREVVKKSGSL
nr:ester cyclase [Photorhabdus thracensis]